MAERRAKGIRTGIATLVAGLCLAGGNASTAWGQSSGFGCAGLESSETLPSVEGRDGMFYRINPDLMMDHAASDESIAALARLSRALEARGTTLIYVPMPTKSLAQPAQLPPMARYLGFDLDIAATVYDLALKDMRNAGVTVVDARRVLARASEEAPAYFGADPRLTVHGSRALAQGIAEVAVGTTAADGLPRRAFETALGVERALDSPHHRNLQEHCQSDLPPVVARQVTVPADQAPGALMEARNTTVGIALLGTALTGTPTTGTAAFLQEASGFGVSAYAVPGGGGFAAISTYLTSDAFQSAPPVFLVWEHPIWENLAQNGGRPMGELVAAAAGSCDLALPFATDVTGNRLRADLGTLDMSRAQSLFFDTGGAPARHVTFSFETEAGHRRTRHVVRHERQALTGRFYMPLAGLGPEGAGFVEIGTDVAMVKPRLFACPGEEAG